MLKAICEVSQVEEGKGTFLEEIIKAIFRYEITQDLLNLCGILFSETSSCSAVHKVSMLYSKLVFLTQSNVLKNDIIAIII